MVNVNSKFAEAQFFYSKMGQHSVRESDVTEFKYYLSAFISAARSILQYIYENSKKKGKLSEYDSLVSGDLLLKFFKDERDANIHTKPVYPVTQVEVGLPATVTIRSVVYADNEKNEDFHSTGDKLRTIQFMFDGWGGDESIMELSEQYLEKLDSIISQARRLNLVD